MTCDFTGITLNTGTVIISDLADEVERIFSKVAGYTKLEGAAAIPSDLDKLEKGIDRSFRKFIKSKSKVQLLGRNNPAQLCSLGLIDLNSSEEKNPSVPGDSKLNVSQQYTLAAKKTKRSREMILPVRN